MPNPTKPKLAVVVPATNRPSSLAACLDALAASTVAPDELVVVDDLPATGPAAARNAGVDRSTAEIVVFVDADVAVHPDALGRLADAFAADPQLAAVFGAYDDRPADPGTVSRFRNLLHHHVHASSPGPASTFWAGLGAVRREPFRRAGGFDARRFPAPSVEDIDLGMRMRAAGGRIALDPDIRGTHLKRWTLGSMLRADFASRGVPWTRLLLERGADSSLNLSARHRLSALAAVGVAAGAVTRKPLVAAACGGALAALNARFYRLLARSGGARLAFAGLGLHVLHQLAAVASVPAAIALHLRERRQ